MTPHILRGERVVLRSLRREDGRVLGGYLRDGQVTRYLPPRVRRETGPQFVARVLREQSRGLGTPFVIVANGTGEVVGQVRFFYWNPHDARAEIGYWVGRRHWGHGYASEAVRLACRFGFRSMHLHRIDALVVADNARSARVLERAGFHLEGTSRSSERSHDGWRDARLYGLLRGELDGG